VTNEKTIRDAIKTQIDAIKVDPTNAVVWNALTDAEKRQAIIKVDYWRPALALPEVIAQALIGKSVHAFIEWGEVLSYTDAHPDKEHKKANYSLAIYLITSGQIDPQGDLMTAEQAVFDKLKTLSYTTYNSTGQRFSTNEDRSVSMLIMDYTIKNITLDS